MLSSPTARRFATACCSLFLLAGAALIPRLGIQADEAGYAGALLPPRAEVYALHLGRHAIPLMLMSYVGTLKALLYRPMIRWFGTGVWATRVPMLLAGAATIWLWYLLLRRIASERAAAIGCGLLATDALFLLTTCFDWGPVALQHLLVAGGLLLVVQGWQERREVAWAAGFFLFGLTLWDKALAVWILTGLAVATLAVFPHQVRSGLTPRRAGVAVLALLLGASPLIWYNLHTRGATLRETATADTAGLSHKVLLLRLTANGSGLFGTLNNEDYQTPRPHAPRNWLERTSAAIASLLGHPRESLLPWAFAAALLLAPLSRGPDLRLILFALITMAVAWGQMVFTARAGGSVHHTILLWPFPQMAIGISFAAASRRLGRAALPVLAAVLAVLMASGLAVINEYHAVMVRDGGLMDWSDAIFPLSEYLAKAPAQQVFAVDWGILEGLRLLDRGRLNLGLGGDPIGKLELSPPDQAQVVRQISRPYHWFVTHVPNLEFQVGLNDKLLRFASERGYRREMLTVIQDSYGRPTFEIFRFIRSP